MEKNNNMKESEPDYKALYQKAVRELTEFHSSLIEEDPAITYGKVIEKLENVFPELAESKDEKIRKELIKLMKQMSNTIVENYTTIEISTFVAWLEKQAEQKPIAKFKVGDRIYDKRDSYNRNVIREVGKDYYINAFGQKMDMAYTNANFEFLEHLEDDNIDSKSAAWSEEDEIMLRKIIQYTISLSEGCEVDLNDQINWLKSLKHRVSSQPNQEVTFEQLAQAKKDAFNEALDKIEYHSGEPTFDDGWSAAVAYLRGKKLADKDGWKPTGLQMAALQYEREKL